MALYKALKIEVMVLTETTLSDADVKKWVKEAMLNFCDFEKAVVTIKESHANLICDPETGPTEAS